LLVRKYCFWGASKHFKKIEKQPNKRLLRLIA
jgi:hypothetical protein